jgi:signal transduction histidine kinase
MLDGVRAVLAADLARTVKTVRIEFLAGDARSVYLIRSVAEIELGDGQHAQLVVLEDWTAEERQARAKSEFIYSVSHELKTPLTAIQASLELANEPAGLEAADRDKLIRVGYEESVRLSQMVAELLDLARIEAGITEFKREPVDLRELFHSLQQVHQPLAERKSIALRWDISDYLPDFVGDARLLRQAFVNVVGNALKYTKSGGEVSLTARLEGPELVTRVRDTGIGIAPEDQPRVFEKFYRAKSAEQSTIQGTGLGLPMALYIVEHHRGRIELTSQVGVGTEFRIYLPAAAGDQDEDQGSSLVAVDDATT